VITMIGSIVRQTGRISCFYLTSSFAIAVVIAFIWLSPAAAAGTNSANEKASPSAQYADSGNSSGSYNYGGMVVAGIIAVLTAVVGAAVWRAHEIAVQKNAAIQGENHAVAARRGAEDIIDHLLEQLREKLEPIDHLDIVEDAQRRVEAYYDKFGFSQQDPEGLSRWSARLQDQGDRLMVQGDMDGALARFTRSLEISRKLVKEDPENSAWQAALSVRYEKVGDLLLAQGDLNRARTQFRRLLEVQQALATKHPTDVAWQRSLLVTHEKIGEVLEAQGDLRGARATYASSLQIMLRLVSEDPSNGARLRELSVIHSRLGSVLKAQGDVTGATRNFRASVEILTALIRDYGKNPTLEWDLDWAKGQLKGFAVDG
jgi:predicted negative regulator of RcsB-dependent stress response